MEIHSGQNDNLAETCVPIHTNTGVNEVAVDTLRSTPHIQPVAHHGHTKTYTHGRYSSTSLHLASKQQKPDKSTPSTSYTHIPITNSNTTLPAHTSIPRKTSKPYTSK